MEIKLALSKTVAKNAEQYFQQAKKARKKAKGAREAVEKFKKKLKKETKKIRPEKKEVPPAKKEWYDKFRWFESSEGFLVLCGRDATTNDILIKKHTEKDDMVFHTIMAGSPFCVIKTEKKKPGEKTVHEAATFTVTFSKAWKLGLTTTDVYHVTPEQVSKTAKAGEYLKKGAFMIYGRKTFVAVQVDLAVGNKDSRIMAGPLSAVKKHCKNYVALAQGREKTSAIAKKIQKKIGGNLDDIIRVLPAGGLRIKQ